MSFDKKIGLFPEDNLTDRRIFQWYGVSPIQHDIKRCMPPGCAKEPEPKLLLSRLKCLLNIRTFFLTSPNAFLNLGQMHQDKFPLNSVLLDTVREFNGSYYPTAELDAIDISARCRFETDPATGNISRRDFNEKTSNKSSPMVGGLADRDERELDFAEGITAKQGYDNFIQHHRDTNDHAYCDQIPYDNLRIFAGYIAARTEYGFVVKHPDHPVLVAFEACEDIFQTMFADMQDSTAEIYEFEFEAKQVWGDLPLFAQSPEGFKHFLYKFMSDIRDSIHEHTPGSSINMKSKADIAKEHVCAAYGDEQFLKKSGMTDMFNKIAPPEYGRGFTPLQYALAFGLDIEDTLAYSGRAIHQRGAKLHATKLSLNKGAPEPCIEAIRPNHEFVTQRQELWRPGLVLAR